MHIFRNRSAARAACLLFFAVALAGIGPAASAQSLPQAATIGPIRLSSQPEIDAGFRLLYELKFPEARGVFQSWENRHPEEALGPAAEAASYLFQEFDRKGVLTSEFFLDDNRLLGGIDGPPDPQTRDDFNGAIQRAQQLARARLKLDPNNADALFALTIATGLQADYSSLVEKKQMETLRLIREADGVAKNLLAVAPSATDAYVALGKTNYIMGCLPSYKRFFLRFGGFRGDRVLGMQQLEMTAASGHYLRPYAKLTLGLAAMREKQFHLARVQFEQLIAEFPANPKFARELAKLNVTIGPSAAR
jgi:hypothetical protein